MISEREILQKIQQARLTFHPKNDLGSDYELKKKKLLSLPEN